MSPKQCHRILWVYGYGSKTYLEAIFSGDVDSLSLVQSGLGHFWFEPEVLPEGLRASWTYGGFWKMGIPCPPKNGWFREEKPSINGWFGDTSTTCWNPRYLLICWGTTKQENPDFYAICPKLAHGSDGLLPYLEKSQCIKSWTSLGREGNFILRLVAKSCITNRMVESPTKSWDESPRKVGDSDFATIHLPVS